MNEDQLKKYRLIDHTADIGIEVFGESILKLFSNAGYALFDIISDVSLVKNNISRNIIITGRDLEEMIVNWLGELLYIYNTEKFIFNKFNIKELNISCFALEEKKQGFSGNRLSKKGFHDEKIGRLFAEVSGEKYNSEIHVINTDIKAITYHKLKVVKNGSGWRCVVIMDV